MRNSGKKRGPRGTAMMPDRGKKRGPRGNAVKPDSGIARTNISGAGAAAPAVRVAGRVTTEQPTASMRVAGSWTRTGRGSGKSRGGLEARLMRGGRGIHRPRTMPEAGTAAVRLPKGRGEECTATRSKAIGTAAQGGWSGGTTDSPACLGPAYVPGTTAGVTAASAGMVNAGPRMTGTLKEGASVIGAVKEVARLIGRLHTRASEEQSQSTPQEETRSMTGLAVRLAAPAGTDRVKQCKVLRNSMGGRMMVQVEGPAQVHPRACTHRSFPGESPGLQTALRLHTLKLCVVQSLSALALPQC